MPPLRRDALRLPLTVPCPLGDALQPDPAFRPNDLASHAILFGQFPGAGGLGERVQFG